MVTKVNTSSRSNAAPSPKKATVVEDVTPKSEAFFDFKSLLGQFELPSGKRVIVSLVAAVVIAGCASYLGMSLVSYLVVGAALLTGSAFITFMVAFLGYALTIIASMVIGGKVQAFILSGDIDRCYQNVSNRVSGWFGSAKNKLSSVQS